MTRKTIYTISYVLVLIGLIGSLVARSFNVASQEAIYIVCMAILFGGLIARYTLGFIESRGNIKRRKFNLCMIIAIVMFFIIFVIGIVTNK